MFNDCSRFEKHRQAIEDSDDKFYAYLERTWLLEVGYWSKYQQIDCLHFGNTTSNRVESAHQRLKRELYHRDPLVWSIQKIWNVTDSLMREMEMSLNAAITKSFR